MNKIKKHNLILLTIFIFIFSGCKDPLQKWVQERKYTYIDNYSSINPLGYIDEQNILRECHVIAVYSKEGKIPNITKEEEVTIEIDGGANLEKTFSKLGDVKVEGDFDSVDKTFIKLVDPFIENATCIIPKAPCNQENMLLVTSVLNTGQMEITILDEKGVDISTKFKVKQIADVETDATIDLKEYYKASGRNYYVGYNATKIKCINSMVKTLTIKRNEPFIDPELGLRASFFEYIEDDQNPRARLHIAPSRHQSEYGFINDSMKIKSLVDDDITDCLQVSTTANFENCYEINKYRYALSQVSYIKENNPNPIIIDPVIVSVAFGSNFGVAVVPMNSGLYVEIISVSKDVVEMKAQLINYENKYPGD
jgi:hypothetical protein